MTSLAPPSRRTAPRADSTFEWETPDCLLCGSRRWSTRIEAPDVLQPGSTLRFTVVQCRDCGLCFTSPRPTAASIGRFYPREYAPHQKIGLTRCQQRRARRWARMPAVLRNRCPEHRGIPPSGEGRLLDFGCGGGTFLHRMHVQGWQVTGLDVSPVVVGRIRAELGLQALAGTLPHPSLEPESFELVTMWMSLEHMHQPREVLAEAHRLLVPGGSVLVAVHNVESAPFRWFGEAWSCLDLPRHLTHFSPATLGRMVREAGFQIGRPRMLHRSGWIRASSDLAARCGHLVRWHHWLRRKWPSRLASAYGKWTGQADGMLLVGVKH